MTKERRICACASYLEAEADDASVEHAVSTHLRQPEHIRYQVLTQLRGDYVASAEAGWVGGIEAGVVSAQTVHLFYGIIRPSSKATLTTEYPASCGSLFVPYSRLGVALHLEVRTR